jgi:hypothetical protein
MGPPFAFFRRMRTPSSFRSLAMLAWASAAFAGDTTYGRTEAVPKQDRASSMPSAEGPFEADDETSSLAIHTNGGCSDISLEAHSAGEFLGGLFVMPFFIGGCYAVQGLVQSHAHLFAGHADVEPWLESRWRLGVGFGTGALVIPGLAGGIPFSLNVEAIRALSPSLQWRLRTGAFGSLLGPDADFRRDVFVDGARIGSQSDEMLGYHQSGYPLFSDALWPIGFEGFYLGTGAGAICLRETIDFIRHTDYGRADEEREENRMRVLPAAEISVGRYGGGNGRRPWRFEIRYQAMLHASGHASSFPSDNSLLTHSLTWEWAWLW